MTICKKTWYLRFFPIQWCTLRSPTCINKSGDSCDMIPWKYVTLGYFWETIDLGFARTVSNFYISMIDGLEKFKKCQLLVKMTKSDRYRVRKVQKCGIFIKNDICLFDWSDRNVEIHLLWGRLTLAVCLLSWNHCEWFYKTKIIIKPPGFRNPFV